MAQQNPNRINSRAEVEALLARGDRDFMYKNLTGLDLSGLNLSNANLSFTDATGTNFEGANLNGADLGQIIGHGANFNGTDMRNTSMGYSDFSNSTFEGANLRGAEFEGVVFGGADLTNAYVNMPDLVENIFDEGPFDPEDVLPRNYLRYDVAREERLAAIAAEEEKQDYFDDISASGPSLEDAAQEYRSYAHDHKTTRPSQLEYRGLQQLPTQTPAYAGRRGRGRLR